ncbi:MAG: C1 family peptidase [Phycisphaeraceae bacterium]|nr:C1 family peptidase [Phycisphaeraceae bacterium]MCW5753526.1 C1 family peptidase [Phycisphaeraceae bacterium]
MTTRARKSRIQTAHPLARLFLVLCCTFLGVPTAAQTQDWKPITSNSIDLRPMFYPVRDQMFRGSCAAFAVIGAMEFYPGVPRLSEAYLYSLIKADALTLEGTNFNAMKEFLERTPLVALDMMPYELIGLFSFDEDNPSEVEIGRAFNLKRGRQAAILRNHAIYQARGVRVYTKPQITWDWIEQTLRSGTPIVCGFRMNLGHWTGAPRGVIMSKNVLMKDGSTRTFEPDGGHAVVAVGYRTIYDPADPERKKTLRQILIRNSWNASWGDQGYGWVTWETYAKDHLTSAMTIDGVDTIVPRIDQAPVLDLRVQGMRWDAGNYSAALSIIIKSNYIPEGGIASVEYTIYSGADAMNDVIAAHPFAVRTSTDVANAFRTVFDGLGHSEMNVKVVVRYRLGGESTLYFPVPEICQWSPAPDIDGWRVPPAPSVRPGDAQIDPRLQAVPGT